MKPMEAPASPSRSTRASGKRVVMRGLLTGLLKGEWSGGARLTEAEAVECFGVSRTPVREALLELQGLGFIELRRNCGAIFLAFGPEELQEIYAVRALLEVEATRLATGKISKPVVERLIEGFLRIKESGGIDPDWELDRTLHRTIADASGNRRLILEISRYGEVIQTVREIVGEQDTSIHETTADEHLEILEALRDPQDRGDAAAAMDRHLKQAAHSAANALRKMRK